MAESLGGGLRIREGNNTYRYHFLTHSKPATHLAALTHIKKMDLVEKLPSVLAEVLQHIAKSLRRD